MNKTLKCLITTIALSSTASCVILPDGRLGKKSLDLAVQVTDKLEQLEKGNTNTAIRIDSDISTIHFKDEYTDTPLVSVNSDENYSLFLYDKNKNGNKVESPILMYTPMDITENSVTFMGSMYINLKDGKYYSINEEHCIDPKFNYSHDNNLTDRLLNDLSQTHSEDFTNTLKFILKLQSMDVKKE
jgi:hypothetical protein